MLQIILRKALEDRGLSSHSAAEEIGVSHTTILRALRGQAVDVDTIIKFAQFLNMKPSDLLNSMGGTSALPEQIAVLLSQSRELEEELKSAVERVQAGSLDVAVLRDIVSYALYKLNSSQQGVPDNERVTKRKAKRS